MHLPSSSLPSPGLFWCHMAYHATFNLSDIMDCPGSRFLLWALGSFLASHSRLQAAGWTMVVATQRRDTQLIPPKRVTWVAQNFTHVKRHYPRHWPWRAARQNQLNLPGLNRLCKQFGIECLGITKPPHFNLCRNGRVTSAKGCISFAMTRVSLKPPGL